MILNNDASHLNLELVDEVTVNNKNMIKNIDGEENIDTEENDDTKEADIKNKDNSDHYIKMLKQKKLIMT